MIDIVLEVLSFFFAIALIPILHETFHTFAPPWLKKILAVACVLLSIGLLSMVFEPNPTFQTAGEIERLVHRAIDVFMFIASIVLFMQAVVLWFDTPTKEMPPLTEQQPHLTFEIKR